MKSITLFAQKKLWLLPVFLMLFFSCRKEYSLENVDTNTNIAAGNWQFKEGGKEFAGNMDTAYINRANQLKELHLIGTSNDGQQTFHLVLYADTFVVGTYKASAYQSSFQYGNGSPLLYDANQLNGEFIVKVNSINNSLITGTFSGTARKDDSANIDIVEGVFKSIFNDNTIPQVTSSGVLGDDNGNCLPITINGNYKQGVVMNPGNSVTVQVTVAVPGTYYIYSDMVNGINFTGSGNFTSTGTKSVTLQGSGIPALDGDQDFIVHYGNSQCAFKITFEQGAAPSGDYMPLTGQSNWTFVQNSINTHYTQVLPGSMLVNGLSYTVIGIGDNSSNVQNDTVGIFRKSSGNYYDLFDYSEFTTGIAPVRVETIILKDNVAQGSTWDGPVVPLVVNGVTVNYHIKFTIMEKAVSATVGTFSFPDVIKVKGELYSGTTYLGMDTQWWYARNVGLVYQKDFSSEAVIKSYQIF